MRKLKRYFPAILTVVGLVLGGCAWLLRPLEAKLTATPTSGPAPLNVEFKISFTGAVTSAVLEFGTGDYLTIDIANPPESVVYRYDAQGQYTARLVVQDAQGRTATDSKTIAVLPGTSCSLGVTPASGAAPLGVLFMVNAEAASGRKIVYWKLEFGDGNEVEFTADTTTLSLNFPYTYTDPGDYTAKLTVRDNTGFQATSQVTVHVTTPPPTISLSASPTSGPVPLTVTFNFTATAGAGAKITKWTLLFGDGDFTGQEGLNVDTLTKTVIHDYTQTGSYTATLRVWDSLNQMSEDTVDIEVTEAP